MISAGRHEITFMLGTDTTWHDLLEAVTLYGIPDRAKMDVSSEGFANNPTDPGGTEKIKFSWI